MGCSPYMQQNLKRVLIVAIWIAAAVGWILYQRSTGLGTIGTLEAFIEAIRGEWWTLLVFVAVYALRPIVLFPASLMTIAGGLLFGPVVGVAATVVGANASAMVAYFIARAFGFEFDDDDEHVGIMKKWAGRMRRNSFESVLLMRLAFLPYDGVNYAAGFLKIKPGAFLLATAIGSLPGTVSFSLAGASIESLSDGPSGVDPIVLIASVVLFVLSIVISQIVKRREAAKKTSLEQSGAEEEIAGLLENEDQRDTVSI